MSKNGFNFKELEQFRDNLLAMKEDAPAIIEELLIGEGVYAVRQARAIAKEDGIVETGDYRMNWHAGDKAMQTGNSKVEHDGAPPRKRGNSYEIDFYNNLDYAKHLEYGFRGHFVPAKHLTQSFINRYKKTENKKRKEKGLKPRDWKKHPLTGIYVGGKDGYIKGKFVLKRAIRRTQTTQNARLTRKWERKVKEYVESKGGGNNDG